MTARVDAGLPICDTWELEEHLRHLERLLRPHVELGVSELGVSAEPEDAVVRSRVDASHPRAVRRHTPPTNKPGGARTHSNRESALITPAWFFLALGVMMLTCGGMLWAWSWVLQRPELWVVGLPIAAGGQIALLVGILLQLERMRRQRRGAAVRPTPAGAPLPSVRKAGSTVRVDRRPAASGRSAHPAADIRPEPLLSDLKAQLDRLAARIAKMSE